MNEEHDFESKEGDWVANNIAYAKKRREMGQSPWNNHEPKGIPVPESGIFPMLKKEYEIAKQLRNSLNL